MCTCACARMNGFNQPNLQILRKRNVYDVEKVFPEATNYRCHVKWVYIVPTCCFFSPKVAYEAAGRKLPNSRQYDTCVCACVCGVRFRSFL